MDNIHCAEDERMSEIAQRLKVVRSKSGLTQDGFADALGEKASKIRDIESGRQRVNDQFLSKLVDIFPVDLNWLFSKDADSRDRALIGPADGNKPFRGDVRIGDQEYATIRVYDVDAAAGNGIVPLSEAAVDQIAFTRAWLMRHSIAADLAGLVRVRGDSMIPTIPDRAYVLVDFRARADWSEPGIYIVRLDDAILVKRLQVAHEPGENWVALISDNPSHKPFLIHDPDPASFHVIARVRAVVADV